MSESTRSLPGTNLFGRTLYATRASLRRRDGFLTFVVVTIGYFIGYSAAVGHLGEGRGTYGLSVVPEPFSRTTTQTAPYQYEPIATIMLGPIDYLFSPIDMAIAVGIAALVGINIAVSVVAWRSPSACGIGGSSAGLFAGVPAMLSGVACCAPAILVVTGIQATAGLLTVFRWLLPGTVFLLVATLVFVGTRVNPQVLRNNPEGA